MIGMDGKRNSGNSVLSMQLDDEDDDDEPYKLPAYFFYYSYYIV